jgi:glycerophosphoryl diester phosphodiesterase
LQALDAGSWFAPHFAAESLPTLEETLRLFGGRLRLNLEVKAVRAGMAVLELLARFPRAEAVVSSFDHALLARLRQAAPELPLAVLADCDWHRALARARALRACAFHLRADLVSRPLLAACHHSALPVYVWTVDDPGQARALVRLGVDGLFTNHPVLLRREFPRERS